MKQRLGVGIVVIVIGVVLTGRWLTARSRRADAFDGSRHGMPIYRSRVVVDPRMPVLDSVLPLAGDSARRRRSPPPRGWQR